MFLGEEFTTKDVIVFAGVLLYHGFHSFHKGFSLLALLGAEIRTHTNTIQAGALSKLLSSYEQQGSLLAAPHYQSYRADPASGVFAN